MSETEFISFACQKYQRKVDRNQRFVCCNVIVVQIVPGTFCGAGNQIFGQHGAKFLESFYRFLRVSDS